MPKAVDEFLEYEGKRKEAFDPTAVTAGMMLGAQGGDWKRTLGQAALGTAMVYGLGTAAGLGTKTFEGVYNKIQGDISRARGFRKMIADNPDLATQDRARTQKIYASFHKLNPNLASDPYIAGSFVRRVNEVGQITPDVARTLVDTQRTMDQARVMSSPAQQGLPFVGPGMVLGKEVQAPYTAASGRGMADAMSQAKRVETAREQFKEQMMGAEAGKLLARQVLVGSPEAQTLREEELRQEAIATRRAELAAAQDVSPNRLEYHKQRALQQATADVAMATAADRELAERAAKHEADKFYPRPERPERR